MIPRYTQRLALTAFALNLIWLGTWLWLDWELEITSPATPAVSTVVTNRNLDRQTPSRTIDSHALMQYPAFYPDRRPHGFRPDAKDEPPAQAPRMDFELTTTVIGQTRAFAMLRLPGSNQSVVARKGEPFEADPSWQVTKIDKNSVSLVGQQGQMVTLTVKPPMPAQLPTSVPPPLAPVTSSTSAVTVQAALPAPITAVQPSQGNEDLRARIEARRRDAESRARAIRTQ